MAYIESRKHAPARRPRLHHTAALSLLAATLPGSVMAQTATTAKVLPDVEVTATSEAPPYKPETVASPKYTEPLRDVPQTVTVIPKEVLADQKLLSLQDALSTVPGITFGAGEGGGGATYDNITFRGNPSNDDITVDGIRDSARVSRSDTFNLEQIEVYNGASSVTSGAGAIGGAINLVSKVAREGDFTDFSGSLGSDRYRRITADVNRDLGDGVAVRLNLMRHSNDVPGRDVESEKRWGVAPSISFGLGSPTRVSLSYLHQEDDNIPQYGVPYYDGSPLPGVGRSDYYGYRNVDTAEIETDAFTALFEHDFNDGLRLRNQTRWQKTTQFSIVDPPQGTWCLPSGTTPTGGDCGSVAPGFYQPSGPRGTTRDTTNAILVNQTDLTSEFETGSVGHTLVTGVSFSRETYQLDNGNSLRHADGASPNPTLPPMVIGNPDNRYGGPVNFIRSGHTDGELTNRAIYAIDTLKFNEQWQATLGMRYDESDARTRSDSIATPADGAAVTRGTTNTNSEGLLSYRAALTFKPAPNGAVFVAYSNSKTPSTASVNGNCVSRSGDACDVKPETAVIYEIGTKWDLLEGRMAVTGSLFRNERTNYKVSDPGNPDNPDGESQLDGRARVDGIALGIAGQLTDRWSVFANYTYLKSKVLQGASNFEASQGRDYAKGENLTHTPDHAFSLWSTYQLDHGWRVGYGVTYQGEMYLNQHSSRYTSGKLSKSDDYWVHRAMVGYRVNRNLDLQLNIDNLFDEAYYTRIRNNGWAVPGDGRSVVLSANYSF